MSFFSLNKKKHTQIDMIYDFILNLDLKLVVSSLVRIEKRHLVSYIFNEVVEVLVVNE